MTGPQDDTHDPHAAKAAAEFFQELVVFPATLRALQEVHARYFDLDLPPEDFDSQPAPEDVWRYDRDFRAALDKGGLL